MKNKIISIVSIIAAVIIGVATYYYEVLPKWISVLIVIVGFLPQILSWKKEDPNNNLKILKILEKQKKDYVASSIDTSNKLSERERQIMNGQKEFDRLIDALKRKGISKENLVAKYKDPLNFLLFSISDQRIEHKKGSYIKPKEEEKKIRNILTNEFGAKRIGGAFWVIPPAYMPENVKDKKDLKYFFEKTILSRCKGHFCKLNLLAFMDLKNIFWQNYLPYKQKKPRYYTIGELLDINDIFNKKALSNALSENNISASDPILQGDVGFFASKILAGQELKIVHDNQKEIEKEIGNLSLRLLADDSKKDILKLSFQKRGIQNSDEVAISIINEAKFWKAHLIK